MLALISATLMCACGNKDVEEAPVPETAQTVETTKTTSTIDYSCYDDLIKNVTDGIKKGLTQEDAESLDISSVFCYEPTSVETRGYLYNQRW